MEERHERYYKLIQDRPEDFVCDGPLKIETDIDEIRDFEQRTSREIGVVYASPYHIMVVDLVYNEPTPGRYFTYERILPRVPKGAVVTIPVLNGRYILLKQYRHALRDYQYAFPRGFAEPGLPAEQNATKELSEELAGSVKEIRKVGTVVADSGLSGNKVSVYLCVMEKYDAQVGYEEITDSVELTPEELKEWIRDGKINDGFTLSALQLLGI